MNLKIFNDSFSNTIILNQNILLFELDHYHTNLIKNKTTFQLCYLYYIMYFDIYYLKFIQNEIFDLLYIILKIHHQYDSNQF